MEYDFRKIEKEWQKQWKEKSAYKVLNDFSKPKCYVLDMFPYPSGAGLHVGHPLGYIASDIYSRYKRLKGFNVLHPMGYDAFGLPAEQYAIEHGVHPAKSTAQNIDTFRKQLDNIGFCYDWDREVRTCEPGYYKWTQWIFLQLFNSFFNRSTRKAESITQLVEEFEQHGNAAHECPGDASVRFTAAEWRGFSEKEKQDILMNYRLAFCGYGEVNWCEALGTVLANDEVVNGVSERGGHPVVKKKLRQWYLRITEYADRLLEGLETIEFSEAMKEMQTNWIGKSYGAEIDFAIVSRQSSDVSAELTTHHSPLTVYTTRPDTIFGVDFMVIAPEHELIAAITTAEQKQAVEAYITYVKSRSDRERQAEKRISGCFTGAYAVNPFNGKQIPIWISEYVLAGYGTGAIMGVPCGDERDHKFAKHFTIPITNIIGEHYNGVDANPTKDAKLENSEFLNGVVMRDAIGIVNAKLEEMGIGKKKVNYKMRDAAFSRQRYWGEPFPIQWKNGVAVPLSETELPLLLPEVESYSPGPEGEGPLANIPEWVAKELETNTMPGYAGSSWYFLRYMDPHNTDTFCDRKVSDYWNQVDLYIGGTEHAVGHLLYSRMWTKALFDLGHIGFDEPFRKLLNQGMIQGVSEMIKEIIVERNSASKYIGFTKVITFEIDGKEVSIKLENKNKSAGKHFFISQDVEFDIKMSLIDPKTSLIENPTTEVIEHHAKIKFIDQRPEKSILNIKSWIDEEPAYEGSILICKNGYWKGHKYYNFSHEEIESKVEFLTRPVVEKMSKSKLNTQDPNDLVEKFGADTFRMYEMFLGPVDQSKPWDTKGIEGVHRFLKKLWRLFFDEVKGKIWTEEKASAEELKVLHRTTRKIEEDTERFSFNTAVSAFMICVNELADLKCHKREILEPLVIMVTSYAPHISEELWKALGNPNFVLDASFPKYEEKYTIESSKEYPVSINGKVRTNINIALDATAEQVQEIAMANELVQKWMEGKPLKKFIFVKGKMINVVI